MLLMLQRCLYPSAACCDVHAVLCQSPCNAVSLESVSSFVQQWYAVMNHSLHVTAMLHNVDDAAVLLVPICML